MAKRIIMFLSYTFAVFLGVYSVQASATPQLKQLIQPDMFIRSITKSNVKPINHIVVENLKSGKRVDIYDLKKINEILFRFNGSIVKEKFTKTNLGQYDYRIRLENDKKQLFSIKFGEELSIFKKNYGIVKSYLTNEVIESYIKWADEELAKTLAEQFPSSSNLPPELKVRIEGITITALMRGYNWLTPTVGHSNSPMFAEDATPLTLVQNQSIVPSVRKGANYEIEVDFPPATFDVYVLESITKRKKCESNGNIVTILENQQKVVYCVHAKFKQGDAYYYFSVNVVE